MEKVLIKKEIDNCSECDNCIITNVPTYDSWERPEKWACGIVTDNGNIK